MSKSYDMECKVCVEFEWAGVTDVDEGETIEEVIKKDVEQAIKENIFGYEVECTYCRVYSKREQEEYST